MSKAYSAICLLSIVVSIVFTGFAQSGGTFVMQKSVIASGGRSAGGGFTLDGAYGQAVAGTLSSGGTFALSGGFFGGVAPTSALVTVNGRVLTSDGRGLRNASVSMTSSQGVVRTATTSSFGFFTFDNVTPGDVYTIRIASRLFRFAPQTVQVNDNLTLPDFVGLE